MRVEAWIEGGTEERGQEGVWKEFRKRWRRMGLKKELRKKLRKGLL
jgi:hypothetical protein